MGQPDDVEWAMEEWGLEPDGGPTDALEWFSGRGGVRVLAVGRGVALIERAGAPLVDDEAAPAVAAEVMAALWRPGGGFPHVSEFVTALTGRPAAVFAELCDSMGEEVVLHGDLHHENILRSGDGWIAIDPKGMVGEREYETGAFIRNHGTRCDDQLAEALGLDVRRIRLWSWAQAHLAAAWSVEDGEDPARWLAVADRLEPLTGR